jgi:hypothetical protein
MDVLKKGNRRGEPWVREHWADLAPQAYSPVIGFEQEGVVAWTPELLKGYPQVTVEHSLANDARKQRGERFCSVLAEEPQLGYQGAQEVPLDKYG